MARTAAIALTILLFTGCESAPVVVPNPEEELLESTASDVEPTDILPVAAGDAVLHYLDRENFRGRWELWPGKGRLFDGGDPHGMRLTTYVNALALEAVENRRGSMPVGAMIVKDNFTAEGELVATTLMYKRPSDDIDWFWLKWRPDGNIDAEGASASGCTDCHGMAADNDYILTESLAQRSPDVE